VRPEIFREFIKPYYARIGAACREQGMHWWLHSCGNNARIGTNIMGDLAEVGLDVFHPVQKGTMDEVAIVRHRNGGRVWQPDDLAGGHRSAAQAPGAQSGAVLEPHAVREKVRFLIDT
jgi:hypothetical protein